MMLTGMLELSFKPSSFSVFFLPCFSFLTLSLASVRLLLVVADCDDDFYNDFYRLLTESERALGEPDFGYALDCFFNVGDITAVGCGLFLTAGGFFCCYFLALTTFSSY